MKALVVAAGFLFFAVPAFILVLIVWGFTNFVGETNETPKDIWTDRRRPMLPMDEESMSWRSESLTSVRTAG